MKEKKEKYCSIRGKYDISNNQKQVNICSKKLYDEILTKKKKSKNDPFHDLCLLILKAA